MVEITEMVIFVTKVKYYFFHMLLRNYIQHCVAELMKITFRRSRHNFFQIYLMVYTFEIFSSTFCFC